MSFVAEDSSRHALKVVAPVSGAQSGAGSSVLKDLKLQNMDDHVLLRHILLLLSILALVSASVGDDLKVLCENIIL
jgi:hypothetical protein